MSKDKQFLYFEQESNEDVMTYSSKYPTEAHLFETKEEALQVACNMNTIGALNWNYKCLKYDMPHKIVEVTITWDVDTVEELATNEND